MLTFKHVGQYKDIALLLTRYGLRDFRLRNSLSEPAAPEPLDPGRAPEPDVQARAEGFAAALKKMGPTFIKFGQVLSTRPDIVPPEYIAALESFQDDLEPFPFETVQEIVEEELGTRLSRVFKTFERAPMAAASLGQVHRAVLRNGREVAVKVQRPHIREAVEKDLAVLTEIAESLDAHTDLGRKMNFVGAVQTFRMTLLNELNYLQEAQNAFLLSRNLADFERIHIPTVFEDFTTSRVLTTEFIHGTKMSKLGGTGAVRHDLARLAAVLIRAYLKQICVDGFWHCDPHPGNLFLRNGSLVLLDFGMTARIGEELQNQIIKLLLGITENRGTDVAEVCLDMGTPQEGFDRERFQREIGQVVANFLGADLRQTSTGQLIFDIIAVSTANNLQTPSEVALMAKTLLHLDGIAKRLDPDFDPTRVIRQYAESLLTQRVRQKLQPRNFYSAFLELGELALELPRHSREFIRQIAAGNTGVNLKLSQADDLLKGMHKIANRITLGLVMAALIVGSSLVMRVPTPWQIFGHPALAMFGYLLAAVLGACLLLSSFWQDTPDRHRAKSKLK
jgi:ubiquinone biosynthesis protein